MTKNYSALHESMQTRTLANGLRICYLPKKGFSKTFAILATDFGSVDASFTFEGKRYDTPAGVAHFLEHKMFEDEDGNALQKFARTGASPNAFTSHTMTAYHFSCTDRFEENLEILLKFVFTPYFTDENVEKERGIINQEIRMVEDTPNWEVFVGAYEGLYRNHPVRVSIPGSEESISHITPELLYTCHRAFYSPKNMALVVCGTADFEQVCRMAEEISPQDAPEIGQRHYGERRAEVHQPVVTRKMQVSLPQCMVGFKDEPVPAGESRLRRSLIGDLAVRILCGDTSPLYAKLYEKRLLAHSGWRMRDPRRREPRSCGCARSARAGDCTAGAGGHRAEAVPPHEERAVRHAPAYAGCARSVCTAGDHFCFCGRALSGFCRAV